jgi:hypothetical protein
MPLELQCECDGPSVIGTQWSECECVENGISSYELYVHEKVVTCLLMLYSTRL